jgi:hypothetical protein
LEIGLDNSFLYTFHIWAIIAAFFVLFLVSLEIGYRFGLRVDPEASVRSASQLTSIEVAVLGILGLLLGFTTSMAVVRFEERKHLVLEEANAIGTSYLRTSLLAQPGGQEIAGLLCRYVEVRLEYARTEENMSQLEAAHNKALRLQQEFWSKAGVYAQNDPHPVLASLLMQSLNQTIDLEAARWMALQNTVPKPVVIANILVALLAGALVGYNFGIFGRREIFTTILLSLVVSAVITVILDLDRPKTGFIQISQQPMIDLHEQLVDSNGHCR